MLTENLKINDEYWIYANVKYHIECLEAPFLETETVSERVKVCKERNYIQCATREETTKRSMHFRSCLRSKHVVLYFITHTINLFQRSLYFFRHNKEICDYNCIFILNKSPPPHLVMLFFSFITRYYRYYCVKFLMNKLLIYIYLYKLLLLI